MTLSRKLPPSQAALDSTAYSDSAADSVLCCVFSEAKREGAPPAARGLNMAHAGQIAEELKANPLTPSLPVTVMLKKGLVLQEDVIEDIGDLSRFLLNDVQEELE